MADGTQGKPPSKVTVTWAGDQQFDGGRASGGPTIHLDGRGATGPSPVDALRARSEGKRGAWYLPQQVDDRSWIVWFPEGFEGGEEILIEPR